MLLLAPSGKPLEVTVLLGPGSPSSSGLGLRPFKAAARVRIPLGARTTARRTMHGPVAQLVSASPCHGEGRGFESRLGRFVLRSANRPDVPGQVAQLVRATA